VCPDRADTQSLLALVDLSRAAFSSDPVTSNQQLRVLLQQLGRRHSVQPSAVPAAAMVMAVQPGAVSGVLSAAVAMQPAFIACYSPSQQLSAASSAFLQPFLQQQRAAVIRVGGGIWICIAPGALSMQHWLQ